MILELRDIHHSEPACGPIHEDFEIRSARGRASNKTIQLRSRFGPGAILLRPTVSPPFLAPLDGGKSSWRTSIPIKVDWSMLIYVLRTTP